MNKSMLMGVALGVGFATAGGVTAYQFLGDPAAGEHGTATVIEHADDASAHAAHSGDASAHSAHSGDASEHSGDSAAATHSPQHVAAPAPASVQAAQEECYEETVTSQPRDQKRIAGTALGAIVGGAIAKDVGDRDLTTAVGAAVGAFAGNKIQQRIQERNTTTTTETRCVPAQ